MKIEMKDFQRKLTDKEIEQNNRRIALCNKYSIPYAVLYEHENNKDIYLELELEALSYIDMDKEIPLELHEKLMDTLEERKARNMERELSVKAASAGVRTTEDVKRVYRFDFEKRTYFGVPFENTELFKDKKKGEQ